MKIRHFPHKRANVMAVVAALVMVTVGFAPDAHGDPADPLLDQQRMIAAAVRAAGIGLSSTDWQIADAAASVCNAMDGYVTTEHTGQVLARDLGSGLTRSQINTFQMLAVEHECPEDLPGYPPGRAP